MIQGSPRGASSRWLLMIVVLFACLTPLACQDSRDTGRVTGGADWEPVVSEISGLLDSLYVYPDVASRMSAELVSRFGAGEFDDIQGTGAFARTATDILQTVSNDLHLRVHRMSEGPRGEREDSAIARVNAEGRRRGWDSVGGGDVRRLAAGPGSSASTKTPCNSRRRHGSTAALPEFAVRTASITGWKTNYGIDRVEQRVLSRSQIKARIISLLAVPDHLTVPRPSPRPISGGS